MVAQRGPNGVEKKKKRSKKRRTRTEVSSSSESDSDVSSEKSVMAVDRDTSKPNTPLSPVPAKKEKKKSKPASVPDNDVPMEDAPPSPPPQAVNPASSQPSKAPQDDFSTLYLRKLATEFADDLDKVREAPDFKASSVPMLIHALKQGESLFAGEKRRVVGATKV